MTTETATAPAPTVPATPAASPAPAKPAPAPRKAPAPKTPAKPAPKKAPAKAAPKASANGKHDKGGLRKPQVVVLKTLAKATKPLTRVEIATKGNTDQAFLSTWIGSSDPAVRKANEAKRGVKGLLTLGYVKDSREEGEPVKYTITAAGRKAVAAL